MNRDGGGDGLLKMEGSSSESGRGPERWEGLEALSTGPGLKSPDP